MTGILGSHRYSILVGAPLMLFALVSFALGRQGTSRAGSTPARPSFPVGQYKLNASVEGLTGLIEFSAAEYTVMGRQFEEEKSYNAPPVKFLGRQWKLQLGTVHGKIYKIAPYVQLKDKNEGNVVAMDALRYCTEKLGKPSEQKTGLFIWDTSDGNVVLQTAERAEGVAVSLFLTSRSVRMFKRLTSPPPFGQERASIEGQIHKWKQDMERDPRDYETLAAIGSAYGKLGEYATAVTYFKKAIALKPSYAEAYFGLGSSYGFLHQPAEAQAALRKAVSLDPKNPYARAKLGSTLGKAGEYKEAVTELREAVRLKPDLADAHFALGLAYLSLGDRRQALAEVDVLSRINPQLARQLQDLVSRSQ